MLGKGTKLNSALFAHLIYLKYALITGPKLKPCQQEHWICLTGPANTHNHKTKATVLYWGHKRL